MDADTVLTWDNAVMGLRVETRLGGLLVQTFIHGGRHGHDLRAGTSVRCGLRVVA